MVHPGLSGGNGQKIKIPKPYIEVYLRKGRVVRKSENIRKERMCSRGQLSVDSSRVYTSSSPKPTVDAVFSCTVVYLHEPSTTFCFDSCRAVERRSSWAILDATRVIIRVTGLTWMNNSENICDR